MKVAVFGATGVLGRNVVPRLLERGHEVRAVVQDEARAAHVGRTGAGAVIGDMFSPGSVRAAVAGCDAVLHLATRIPRARDGGDWSENDRIRREGTRNLLQGGARRYVQQSIIMLYGDRGAELVDESAPLRPASYIQSAADMEEMVQQSPCEWSILRGGYFYGPGTGMDDELREAAREGTLQIPGDGSALISLIHVVDMARAVVLAMESAPPRSIYNVVDDQPVTYRGSPRRSSLAVSNGKIKRELGWWPAYPSFRSGLA